MAPGEQSWESPTGTVSPALAVGGAALWGVRGDGGDVGSDGDGDVGLDGDGDVGSDGDGDMETARSKDTGTAGAGDVGIR